MSASTAVESATVTCTIALEWENYHIAEAWRPRAMLERLRAQSEAILAGPHDASTPEGAWLARFQGPFELIMAYNPDETDDGPIRAMADEVLGGCPSLDVQWIAAPGARYYELKNVVTRQASGDMIVYTDTDVVPHDHWLRNMLATFHDPAIEIVTGLTVINPVDLMAKAFALSWVIPLGPLGAEPVHGHHNFQANNFAMRRPLAIDHQFPHEPERERGACDTMAKRLKAEGHTIYRNLTVNTDHPRPFGAYNILARALCPGTEFLHKLGPKPGPLKVAAYAIYGTIKRLAAAVYYVVRDHRRVNLPWWQIPAALAVLMPFYSLFGVGMIWGYVAPAHFRRHVRL